MNVAVFFHHILEAARQTGLPVPDVLARARLAGISGLECSIEEVQAPGFDALLAGSGLAVSSIYAFFDFGRTGDPQPALELLDAASRTGCRQVMVIPGFVRAPDGSAAVAPELRQAAVDRMVAATLQVCQWGRERGIGINMEDFDDAAAPYATHTELRCFLDALPGLGCAFDTGNFRYSGVDELEALALLADRVVHVHCKDRSLAPLPGGEAKAALDGTILWPADTGSGVIRLDRIVRDLLARGYAGWFVVEHFGVPDYLASLERSARWLLSRAAQSRG